MQFDVLQHSLLIEKLNNLGDNPGVYLWKNNKNEVIYVGKAKALKNRTKSYLTENQKELKTKILQSEIYDLDWIATNTEKEALILESGLIKKYNPKYNVRLKDDKKYPYICVSKSEPYPRVFITRESKNNRNLYFGPYTDVRAVRNTLNAIYKLFPIRKKKLKLPLAKPQRACLNFFINRCLGPCQGNVTTEDYSKVVDQIIQFLKGKKESVISDLRKNMIKYSENLEFEKAGKIRDVIFGLEELRQKQVVVDIKEEDEDVLALAVKENEGQIVLMEIRSGRLENKKSFPLTGLLHSDQNEIINSFVRDYYLNIQIYPKKIILPNCDVQSLDFIQTILEEKSGEKLEFQIVKNNNSSSILNLARKNAELELNERLLSENFNDSNTALLDLKEKLKLDKIPRLIECFDISHIQGFEPVASKVSFLNGKPNKNGYRKYNIRGYKGINDPGMIHEAVSRRLQRILNEQEEVPDLIVIDGGITQLNKACESALALGFIELYMIGLAKKKEEIYVPGNSTPFEFDKNSKGLRLIRRLRDEAHRFGVEHHRKRRKNYMLKELTKTIPDIGIKRIKILFKYLDGDKKISDLSEEELMNIPGIGKKLAYKIVEHYKKERNSFIEQK